MEELSTDSGTIRQYDEALGLPYKMTKTAEQIHSFGLMGHVSVYVLG